MEDNVFPIVEELQRRLPLATGLGEGEDDEQPQPGIIRTDNELTGREQLF